MIIASFEHSFESKKNNKKSRVCHSSCIRVAKTGIKSTAQNYLVNQYVNFKIILMHIFVCSMALSNFNASSE